LAVDPGHPTVRHHSDLLVAVVPGRPAASTWSSATAGGGSQTDATGRIGVDSSRLDTGRLDTGRLDTRGLDGWTAAGRIAGPRTTTPGDRTPDGRTPAGWTAGSRTTNRLGGRRLPDTGDRRHGGVLAVSTTATTLDAGCPLAAEPGRRVWASSNQDRSVAPTTRASRCCGRVWPPPRRSAAGGTPPSSWRLGALLSSD
jgi:hypothetical protein